MTHPFLALEGINRQWGGVGGVREVSLAMRQGEFMSILGPSGCGKSTLLRLIAGLEQPQSGQIFIDGRNITALPPAKRGLSMVFQSYALFPHLSVAENILFGLKVRKVARSERNKRLTEAVEMTGLQGLEQRKPAELSGGQRQRVALARAAVADQPLCLMDEPLSNLDAKLRHSVRRDIRDLQRRLQLTVVYVTHDQGEAMSLSDRVILMNAGEIEQIGTPTELYDTPASTFAAQFIGEPPMALIDGAALGLSDSIRVGIRPEKLQLCPVDQAQIQARVSDTEFLGSETRLVLDHPAALGLAALQPGARHHVPGDIVGIRIPEQDRLLFDARTGKIKKEPQQDYEMRNRQNSASRDGQTAPSIIAS